MNKLVLAIIVKFPPFQGLSTSHFTKNTQHKKKSSNAMCKKAMVFPLCWCCFFDILFYFIPQFIHLLIVYSTAITKKNHIPQTFFSIYACETTVRMYGSRRRRFLKLCSAGKIPGQIIIFPITNGGEHKS